VIVKGIHAVHGKVAAKENKKLLKSALDSYPNNATETNDIIKQLSKLLNVVDGRESSDM